MESYIHKVISEFRPRRQLLFVARRLPLRLLEQYMARSSSSVLVCLTSETIYAYESMLSSQKKLSLKISMKFHTIFVRNAVRIVSR